MTIGSYRKKFETAITEATQPINGQYPRPWMTDLRDPLKANVFIVGRNQKHGYDTKRLTHKCHIDALFNRNGESCRKVYDDITGGTPSPTRKNTDRFRAMLKNEGVTNVLETNVICYSTPMSADLGLPEHRGGALRGSEVFQIVFNFVRPKVIIAHGSGTRKNLAKVLGVILPEVPVSSGRPVSRKVGRTVVYVIPSLAPPKWNQWQSWAPEHLRSVAKDVASVL